MNISALLVFISAVVSVYGYHKLPCSDCDQPCSPECLGNVTKQFLKYMNFEDCRQNNRISSKANPTWKCKPSTSGLELNPKVFNATCGKCADQNLKAVPILQNISMVFKQICPNRTGYFFKVKPVTISLGCTCANYLTK